MSLYFFSLNSSSDGRDRYLDLKKERERRLSIKLSVELKQMRHRALFNGHHGLKHAIGRAIKLHNNMSIAMIRQRMKFVSLITRALRSPGLGMPSFFGISLTRSMKTLILRIIRKKHDIWIFQLRQQWLSNQMAAIANGRKIAGENAFLNKISEMKEIINNGRMGMQSEYSQNIINGWYSTVRAPKKHMSAKGVV